MPIFVHLLQWLHDKAWIALVGIGGAIGGILAWLAGRQGTRIVAQAQQAAYYAAHQAAVEKALIEKGRDAALVEVGLRYKNEVNALDESQRKQADALTSDPVALARFLVSVGRPRQ